MKPLALAHAYMEIFFSGSNLDALRPLFADDLVFEGPFYTFDSADAYLDSLRAAPPEGMQYDILAAFETASSACLLYQFSKPGIQTPMAQLFETEGDTIRKIVLIFDTGAFVQTTSAAMGFYDTEDNIKAYLAMAEGYDGADLIAVLKRHLPANATVLELGMGPGKDLDLLRSAAYAVTGSDTSQRFLDRYRALHPDADLLFLDAKHLDTPRTFDCIYSNKVLHHLTRAELEASLQRQHAALNDGGLLMHAFWYGTGEETMHGLRFTYYTEGTLREVLGEGFEVLVLERYQEMEAGDSLYILLRKSH